MTVFEMQILYCSGLTVGGGCLYATLDLLYIKR
jgi:hypothetical protein